MARRPRRPRNDTPRPPSVNSHVKVDGSPKQQYRTQGEAQQAAQAAWSRDRVELDTYRCPVCHQWHIGGSRGGGPSFWSLS